MLSNIKNIRKYIPRIIRASLILDAMIDSNNSPWIYPLNILSNDDISIHINAKKHIRRALAKAYSSKKYVKVGGKK